MRELTQNTLIPIGLVIVIGSMIFSLGQSYSKLDEHANKIITITKRQDKSEDKLNAILQALARIEERLAK